MTLEEIANNNIKKLKENQYPGRGIIIGKATKSNKIIQIYWIMGRSESSRNRIFIKDENNFVKTKLFNENNNNSDLSLIIYYPIKSYQNFHIIGNGDQTDTIYEYLKNNKTFEDSLDSRLFEHDKPNFTPRISGIIDISNNEYKYKLSIIKSINNDPNYLQRNIFKYKSFLNGYGHYISTYCKDSNPLISYKGEPEILKIFDDIEENLEYYWNILNCENKISMLVKSIEIETGKINISILNKHRAECIR